MTIRKRKQRLSFLPYTKEEADKLMAAPTSDKIKSVKSTKWYNSKTKEFLFGINVIGESGEECGLCEGNRAVVFEDRNLCNKVVRSMNKELSVNK
jgi:hypothetical protein